MEYPKAIRPSEDPAEVIGQMARDLYALLEDADSDDRDERLDRRRWQAYALQSIRLLNQATERRDWSVGSQVMQALQDFDVLGWAEAMGDERAALRFDVIGIGPLVDYYLSCIELLAYTMAEFAFRDFLKTEEGRPVLETLRSLDAEPRRWLTVSEVAERNRYGHQTMDEKRLAKTLVDLLDRGLAQRLLGFEEVATETGPLDLKEVTGRTYPVYAITQAGHEMALLLQAVGQETGGDDDR
jgi:hypothetical protein